MTPVYLNPPASPFPFLELKEEQHHHDLQLFLSPQQAAAASASASASSQSADHPIFFSNTDTSQDQRVVPTTKPEEPKPYDHKISKYMRHDDGSSSDQQVNSSMSSLKSSAGVDHGTANGLNLALSGKDQDDHGDYESTNYNVNNGSSLKWMPSKMRIMRKMMNKYSNSSTTGSSADHKPPKFQYPIHDNSVETNSFMSKINNSIRACSDCNTTTTPLWRSGPRGPKSLCNACGIRQRKARRAMEAAAAAAAGENGVATADASSTSMKIKVHINKEKKSRSGTSHVAQYKKQFKPAPSDYNSSHHHHHFHSQSKKLCFKEFALGLSKNSALQRMLPQDVEDAAILLMELSCGLVHS